MYQRYQCIFIAALPPPQGYVHGALLEALTNYIVWLYGKDIDIHLTKLYVAF